MHHSPLLIALALAATWTGQAQAAGFSVSIAASVDGGPASDGPVMARAGQTVVLYAVVATGRGRQSRYATSAPALTLRGRRIPSTRLAPPDAKLRFSWWLVEPYPHHKNLPPPNTGNPAYSNAELFGPQHGRWLGYDTLEYHETPLLAETGPQLIVKRVSPTDPHVNVHAGLGTMRYKVAASDGAFSAASPGMEAKEGHGIARRVMRVSFRRGDDVSGRLTVMFNVPNVFGSGGSGAQHQTDLFQGADCADVIIGALRAAGLRLAYTSVKGLLAHARPVTPILVMDETSLREQQNGQMGAEMHLRFGADVQPGDLMLIDYLGVAASPRTWDHVAVVSADAGIAGEFDPKDLVMHVGYLYGLTEDPAATQVPALVQFLRWKREVTSNLERAAKSEARGRRLPAPPP